MKWILLALTVVCAAITVDAYRWKHGAKDIPFSAISRLWKGGLDHLSPGERTAVRARYESWHFGIGNIALIFSVLSIAFAVATVAAFLE
jgi:hypothetical protein